MLSILNPDMANENETQSAISLGKAVLYVAAALCAGGGGGAFLGSSYGATNVSRDPGLERRLTIIETRLENLAKTSERVEQRLDVITESVQTNAQKKGR